MFIGYLTENSFPNICNLTQIVVVMNQTRDASKQAFVLSSYP